MTSPYAALWSLDPEVTHLNHGSFGACPTAVLEAQAEFRARMERDPMDFFLRWLPGQLDSARHRLATFLNADPEGLGFVSNVTTGVNTVLAAYPFEAGDEVLVTDHEYRASANAAVRWTAVRGATVKTAPMPFPCDGPDTVVDTVMGAVGPRTRLVLIDHITSPTGLVQPLERLVPLLQDRGIDVLVDGAHAAGMIDLDLDALGVAYYTGNAHKWLCTPKGSAYLWVRADKRAGMHPLVTSHGLTLPDTERSRFRLQMDWAGTMDPTPFLSIPVAIDHLEENVPGGWPEIRKRNHALVVKGRQILMDRLGLTAPCPDSMLGTIASLEIAPRTDDTPPGLAGLDALYDRLMQLGLTVPVFAWPAAPRRWLRISAQLYNHEDDYGKLADVLASEGITGPTP